MMATPEDLARLLDMEGVSALRIHQLTSTGTYPVYPPLELRISDGAEMAICIFMTMEPSRDVYNRAAARLLKTAADMLDLGEKMHPTKLDG